MATYTLCFHPIVFHQSFYDIVVHSLHFVSILEWLSEEIVVQNPHHLNFHDVQPWYKYHSIKSIASSAYEFLLYPIFLEGVSYEFPFYPLVTQRHNQTLPIWIVHNPLIFKKSPETFQ